MVDMEVIFFLAMTGMGPQPLGWYSDMLATTLVMGPGQNFLTQVRSGQFFVGRVSHLWFGLEFGKFQLKTSNFSIFSPSGQKKLLRVRSESIRVKAGSASYLLRVKSKLGSGRVEAHLYTTPLWLLVGYFNYLITNLKIIPDTSKGSCLERVCICAKLLSYQKDDCSRSFQLEIYLGQLCTRNPPNNLVSYLKNKHNLNWVSIFWAWASSNMLHRVVFPNCKVIIKTILTGWK